MQSQFIIIIVIRYFDSPTSSSSFAYGALNFEFPHSSEFGYLWLLLLRYDKHIHAEYAWLDNAPMAHKNGSRKLVKCVPNCNLPK